MPLDLPQSQVGRAALVLTLLAVVLLSAVHWIHPGLEWRNADGLTPLQVAALRGDHERMRRLLAQGAVPDSKNPPPLVHSRTAVALRDLWGFGDVHVDPTSPLLIRATACDREGVVLLLDHGAADSFPALEVAIRGNCTPVVEALLASGARASGRYRGAQDPPIAVAIDHARPHLLRLLLEAGDSARIAALEPPVVRALSHCSSQTIPFVGPEWQDGRHQATPADVREMVRALAEHGADTEAPGTRWDLTPLDWAEGICHDPELTVILESAGATATGGADAAVRAALILGDLEQLKAALAAGGSPDQTLPHGRTLLQWAYDNPPLADELRRALAQP